MKILRAVVVEDEIHNLELMLHFIEKYCPHVQTVGQGQNKKEAVKAIDSLKPDLIFLDIRLEDETGFEVLEAIEHDDFQVIFVTAYDEYALQAFRHHAVDYLLKPLQIDELVQAVARAEERYEQEHYFERDQLRALQSPSQAGAPPTEFIAVSNVDKISFVKQDEIIYCKSSGRYTEFHLTEDRMMVASKLMGTYQEEMDPKLFFRTHKSYLVNVRRIQNIHRRDGLYCEMNSGDRIPISRRRLEELMQFLKLH